MGMAYTQPLDSTCYWCSVTVMLLSSQGGGRGSPWRMILERQNMGHTSHLLGPEGQAHRQEYVSVWSWLLEQLPSCRRGEKGESCLLCPSLGRKVTEDEGKAEPGSLSPHVSPGPGGPAWPQAPRFGCSSFLHSPHTRHLTTLQ